MGDVAGEDSAHNLDVGHCGGDGLVPESNLVLFSLGQSHHGSLGDRR